ncbi:MAG: TolC family protein [Muribaculaceae bacterium]|nr:TolC family protein [Muribaculaceae bacterium]
MKKLFFLIFILTGLNTISAQNIYEEVYRLVKENNPDLLSMRSSNRLQLSEMRLENNLEDPEVEFGRVWGTNTPENKWDLSVSQTFDFPILYSARRKAEEAKSQELDMDLNVLTVEKLQEAKIVLIQLAYCKKVLSIQSAIMANLDSVQVLLERGYRCGESTILEVNKAKIEYVNVCKQVSQTQAKENELLIELNALCGGHFTASDDDLDYPVHKLEDIHYYYDHALNNSVITAYNAKLKSEMISNKVLKLQGLPKIMIGYQHEREGSESFDGFKLGLTLPVFSLRGKARRAEDAILSINYELDAVRLSQISVIDTEYADITAIRWLLERMAPVFNQTNHPELLKKAFLGGELSALDYLTELNYFREAEAEFLQSEMDYHVALAQLERYVERY